MEYEPVKDILVRLEENEGEFLKGYRDLCKMLEMDEELEKNMEKNSEKEKEEMAFRRGRILTAKPLCAGTGIDGIYQRP